MRSAPWDLDCYYKKTSAREDALLDHSMQNCITEYRGVALDRRLSNQMPFKIIRWYLQRAISGSIAPSLRCSVRECGLMDTSVFATA